MIAALSFSSLLKANSFPKDRSKWDGKLHVWEDYSLPLHKALKRESRIATGRGDVFGSTHSATLIHSITPYTTAGKSESQGAGAPASFMDHFDSHYGALSAAATGSTVVM